MLNRRHFDCGLQPAHRGRRYIGEACETPLVTLRETVTFRWAAPKGGTPAYGNRMTANALNGDGLQTCARCPARSFPISTLCYSPLKPFKLRDPRGGVAYSRPSFLIGGHGAGAVSHAHATVLHLFNRLKPDTASSVSYDGWDKLFETEEEIAASSLCAFPEGSDADGYGPGYSTFSVTGDKLARWLDSTNGELWKARSDATVVSTAVTLVLKSDETQLMQRSAGQMFEALISDLGIVPFFPTGASPNPHYFGIDNGIQADDVAAPESRLRDICASMRAKAAGADDLANFVARAPLKTNPIAPWWGDSVKLGEIVGTWRLISVGLSSGCTYVGHFFTKSLWNCEQFCLSKLRCNTITFHAERHQCIFHACSPGRGFALSSGIGSSYKTEPAVYTWLSAPGKATHLLCGTHAAPSLHAHASTSTAGRV